MKILLVVFLASLVTISAARRDPLPQLIASEDVDDSPELSDSVDRSSLSKTLWKGIDMGAERSKNVGTVKDHSTYDSDLESESESESESDSDSTSEEDSTIEDESESQSGERTSLKEAIKRRVGELLIEKIKSALPAESSIEEMEQDDDKYYDSFEPEAYEDSEEYDDTYDEDEGMDYNYVGRLPARLRPIPMKQPDQKVVIVRKTINVNVNNDQPPAQQQMNEEGQKYTMRKPFLDKRPENDVKDMPRPNPFVVRPLKLSVDPPKVPPPPMEDFDEGESSEEILTKPDKELKPIEDVGPAKITDTSDEDEDTVVLVKKHHFLPVFSQYRLDVIDVILITTTVILAAYVIRSVISILRTPRAAVKPSDVNPSLQGQYPKNPPTTYTEPPANCKNTADVKIHIKEDI